MKTLFTILAVAFLFTEPDHYEYSWIIAQGPDAVALSYLMKEPHVIQQVDRYRCTPLHYAARFGRTNTVVWLIEHKADVNAVAYNGFTPLHLVTNGFIAKLLMRAGANLNVKDALGRTPLQDAARRGHTEVCDAIVESGYPCDLMSALQLGKRDLAKELIKEHPASVKHIEPMHDLSINVTPLGIAAFKGDREMVDLLLRNGAPVNGGTERENVGIVTPLWNAVVANHYEIAEVLCNAGADCNEPVGDKFGNILRFAQGQSDGRMARLLIAHGATNGVQKGIAH